MPTIMKIRIVGWGEVNLINFQQTIVGGFFRGKEFDVKKEVKVIPHYIQADNGYDLADQLTKFIISHDIKEIQGDNNTPYGRWVWYQIEQEIVESVMDKFEQNDETYQCRNCPYLEVTSDKRRKTFKCEHASYGASMVDSPACEKFYEDLLEGKIEIVRK